MACGAKETTGQREATHARPRRNRRRTPPVTLGESRKELCFRFNRRQKNSRRSVRRQKPAHRLSLHVWPGLEGGVPQLLLQYGSHGWRARAFGATRCLICGGFTSTFV